MILKRNLSRAATLLVFAGIALCGMGCGGLGASGSVSPASFFLPGLMHNDTQKPKPEDTVEQGIDQTTSPQVAAYSADLVQ